MEFNNIIGICYFVVGVIGLVILFVLMLIDDKNKAKRRKKLDDEKHYFDERILDLLNDIYDELKK